MSLLSDLADMVGRQHASDDPALLETYSRDHSFEQPRLPTCVASAESTEQIQALVKYANERRIPVTVRSSRVGFYGAGIPMQGGIVLDLSGMNKILMVDPKDKRVMIEPGVTYAQLQAALNAEGMQVCLPLLPHSLKSALSSSLEREPILIAKPEYTETLLTSGMVLANGELLRTGSALGWGLTSGIYPEGLYPGAQLYKGAQGTLGIVAWANLKIEWLPRMDKVYFLSFDRIEDVPEPLYRMLRREIGREVLVLNAFNLAAILADGGPDDFESLKRSLPAFTLILCLAGPQRFPEEKIAYEEEVVLEVARALGCEPSDTVAGLEMGTTLIAMLRQAWPTDGEYWKLRYKGGCHEIMFYTTLERVPSFKAIVDDVAARHGYPVEDIGCYIQPLEYGRICHCQFSFSCDDADPDDVGKTKALFLEAGNSVFAAGGFFATPYGPWADMVFSRTAGYTAALKTIKKAFDPNNILNPGRLCF